MPVGRGTVIRSGLALMWSISVRAATPAGSGSTPDAHTARSSVDRPARNNDATMLPMDVPTTTSAVRGSHPVSCCSARRAPA